MYLSPTMLSLSILRQKMGGGVVINMPHARKSVARATKLVPHAMKSVAHATKSVAHATKSVARATKSVAGMC